MATIYLKNRNVLFGSKRLYWIDLFKKKGNRAVGIFLCLFYGTGSVEEITLIYTMIVGGVNSPHYTNQQTN